MHIKGRIAPQLEIILTNSPTSFVAAEHNRSPISIDNDLNEANKVTERIVNIFQSINASFLQVLNIF